MNIIDYVPNMEITENCIIRNMPSEIYHSVKGISNSGLKMLLDCPARYYYKYLSGEYEPKEKPHFKIGKACHCYILEGKEAFEKKYWHNPYADMTKSEIVELLKSEFGYDSSISKFLVSDLMEMLLDNAGIERKEIHLNRTEMNQVIGTARAIKANKHAYAAFSQKGESELSIFWKEGDVWLKCRPDFLPYDCLDIPDYKTCQSVNPEIFYKDFLNYGYHIHAAMYKRGIQAVTGIGVQTFFFVAQEKEPPYITQVYVPDMALVEFGNKTINNAIEVYKDCQTAGIWQAYTDKVIEMTIQDKPDELMSNFDKENGICYAPRFLDAILSKYEA